MAAPLVWAGLLGSILLFEGVAALLEEVVGDPEADVVDTLTRLSQNNQRQALGGLAREQLGAEEVERQFSAFNRIPGRILTTTSLQNAPQPFQEQDTGVLDMVSQRLGVSPQMMSQASHPNRLGDMSQVYRNMGQTLEG